MAGTCGCVRHGGEECPTVPEKKARVVCRSCWTVCYEMKEENY